MSLEGHLVRLREEHAAVQQQLDEAKHHPAMDDLSIARLKRRKLVLKDRIAELERNMQEAEGAALAARRAARSLR